MTAYSVDPSMTTRTGEKQQRGGHCLDRLDHACRTTCDALWWLLTESSSPEERQHQQQRNTMPRRSHRLRIIDDNVQEKVSTYPADSTPQSNTPPPIRWKNKGNTATLSSQSTSSSGLSSSVASSVGTTEGEGRGLALARDKHTNKTQLGLLVTATQTDATKKPSVTFKAHSNDSSVMSASECVRDRDLQTVDSKILQRRRQQRKVKDTLRFKNLSNPEIIDGKLSHRTESTHQGNHRGRVSRGLPPLVPRDDITTQNISAKPVRPGKGGILRKNGIGWNDRPQESTTSSSSSSDPWDRVKEEAFPPNTEESDDPEALCDNGEINQHTQKAPAAFWTRDSISQSRKNPTPPLPRITDRTETMDRHQESSSRLFQDPLQPEFSVEDLNEHIEDQIDSETSSCRSRGENVALKAPSSIERDDVETPRHKEGEMSRSPISAVRQNWSRESTSSIEGSISIVSSDVSSRRSLPRQRNATGSTPSSLSVRSFNSARFAKETFLQSRPSFELTQQISRFSFAKQPAATKKTLTAKRQDHKKNPGAAGSVASMDRKMRTPPIQVRKDNETMSVY